MIDRYMYDVLTLQILQIEHSGRECVSEADCHSSTTCRAPKEYQQRRAREYNQYGKQVLIKNFFKVLAQTAIELESKLLIKSFKKF